MTVAKHLLVYGRIKTLKALGLMGNAKKLEYDREYAQKVIENEGVIPYNERPTSTQLKLSEINAYSASIDEMLFELRKKTIKRNKKHTMSKEGKAFKDREKKLSAFKAELAELTNKYNFGIEEVDDYDEYMDYCGMNYHFVIEGETWHSETIHEILNEIIGIL